MGFLYSTANRGLALLLSLIMKMETFDASGNIAFNKEIGTFGIIKSMSNLNRMSSNLNFKTAGINGNKAFVYAIGFGATVIASYLTGVTVAIETSDA